MEISVSGFEGGLRVTRNVSECRRQLCDLVEVFWIVFFGSAADAPDLGKVATSSSRFGLPLQPHPGTRERPHSFEENVG